MTGSYGPATPASLWVDTSCSLCRAGQFNPVSGSTTLNACVECMPGKFAAIRGLDVCSDCPIGTFRSGVVLSAEEAAAVASALKAAEAGQAVGARSAYKTVLYADLMGDDAKLNCQSCGRYPEHKCSKQGMPFPFAAAGYYGSNGSTFAMPTFGVCQPFEVRCNMFGNIVIGLSHCRAHRLVLAIVQEAYS